jgi:hypothetical protein
MPLINTSVPNLIQGVSQQADIIRYAGQCEEQENALSSVSDGLSKRAGANHIVEVTQNKIKQDSFIHFVDRSATERYVIIHTGDYLYAYNLFTGSPASIWYNTVEYTDGWAIPEGHYLRTSGSPLANLKGITIGDSSFITNKNVVVEASDEVNDSFAEEAIVVVNQGDYEKKYSLIFGETGPQSGTVLSFDVDFYNLKTGIVEGSAIVLDGETLSNAGAINVSQIVNIIQSSADFTPNLTNQTGILSLTMTDLTRGISTRSYPLAISTSSNGLLLSVTITEPISTATYSNTAFLFTVNGLTQRGSLGVRTVDTGAADASNGGKNADTSNIASQLAGGTTAGTNNTVSGSIPSGFTAEAIGGVIRIKRTDGASFSISTSDGLADEGLSLAYKSVESLSDLPKRNFNDFKIKILGDSDVDQDDYYVHFKTDDNSIFGEGEYIEIANEGIEKGIDISTFPHRLVNDELNSFVVETCPLEDRVAGDIDSNPQPNFVGNKISNLIIHRNRLGVLSNDQLSFSESDKFFNFFRVTVSSFLDSAPINVSIATKNVINIIDAIGFQDSLILFTRRGQYSVKGEPTLTAKTIAVSPLTSYETSELVSPISLGSYIYFGFDRKQKSGLREYTVNTNTNTFDASDITEAVPFYIGKNIKTISGSATEQMLAVGTEDDLDTIYVYSYFWSNNAKVLSAWSKFKIKGDIVSSFFIDSSLYVITTIEGSTNILEINLEKQEGTADEPEILMDYRFPLTLQSGQTHIDLPYSTPANTKFEVYSKKGSLLKSTSHTRHITLLDAPEEETEVYIGLPFNMKYVFSRQLFKAPSESGKTATNAISSRLKSGSIFFNKARTFKVTADVKLRDSVIATFDANVVGEAFVSKTDNKEGVFRFFVLAPAEDTTITLENDTVFSSSFLSAEFESFIHQKSSRYA